MDSSVLDYMYSLMREGIKLDLDVTREFNRMLGDPDKSFQSVHIAGSNGKGSTSAFVYNILQNSARTGIYTSPHLVDFNERILSGREYIPDSYIEHFINEYRGTIDNLKEKNRNPTFFELTTVMAFKYFQETGCKYSSVEVGLGGRLDSTNIITPMVSVITQVGYEHAMKLGCSLTSISFEKGGIIKRGVPVVLGDNKPEVYATVRRIAESRDSPLKCTWKDARAEDFNVSVDGVKFRLNTDSREYRISSALPGLFQKNNIICSVLAIESSGESLSRTRIEKGIANTLWPGRMQVISKDPLIMMDSSHNPPAAHSLVSSYRAISQREPLLLVGMLSDKDVDSYLRILRGLSGRIVFTTPEEPERAIPPAEMYSMYAGLFREARVIEDPVSAYEQCISSGSDVLVTGSMYLLGKIMKEKGMKVKFFNKE
ncbi:MAG: bifunctional folylpolyglutamate synthase/dihydrofolate synthase [Candidatus Thermoplasmatota archaeon]|jgi:dihydrofolate synthase/folylpolyglutamate synthase|nr:bifunctional folylpolyglutamate synthase/dihydrofolate synthase [Candidatus Thermoplasmatota archaeon]